MDWNPNDTAQWQMTKSVHRQAHGKYTSWSGFPENSRSQPHTVSAASKRKSIQNKRHLPKNTRSILLLLLYPQPRACVTIEKSRHSNRSDSERAASSFRHQPSVVWKYSRRRRTYLLLSSSFLHHTRSVFRSIQL